MEYQEKLLFRSVIVHNKNVSIQFNLPGQIEPVQDKNDYLLTGVIGLCDVYHICRHIHSCINLNFTNYSLTSVALDTGVLPTNTTEYIDSIPNNPHAWLMVPFLVHFFASEGLFYAAILATRLCIDKICFCVALAVGTPIN
jgi:hypothetical protein